MSALCFAVMGVLGFAPACILDSPPLRCERYAQILRDPQYARRLGDWYDNLPRHPDRTSLKHASGWIDHYQVPLGMAPASIGLNADAEAAVRLDPDTGTILTASITDGEGVFFVFPPGRMDGVPGRKALKLPRTDKVAIYCHFRD